MECEHPYSSINLIKINERGSPGVMKAFCNKCGKPVIWMDGVVKVVVGLRDELIRVRMAICQLGGKVIDEPVVPKGHKEKKEEECPHYLGWLDITNESASRGRKPTTTIRCRNCGVVWTSYADLLMAMKKSIEGMWLEIQRLGGRRSP